MKLPHTINASGSKKQPPSLEKLWQPIERFDDTIPPLEARGNRPLKLTFEHQLKSLVCFHLQEHDSARHLLQFLEIDTISLPEAPTVLWFKWSPVLLPISC